MGVVGILHLFMTALLVAVCLPLKQRKIPRNGWYGVRIPASMASDEAWYAYNEYFGRRLLGWSIPFGLWAVAEIVLLDRVPLPWRHFAPLGSLVFLAIPVIQTVFWHPPVEQSRP